MDFIVLDIETTGYSLKGGKIIEIGAVKVKDSKVVEEFSQLINPGCSIPKKITNITNIDNAMVEGCPSIHEVLQDFWEFIDGSVIVAHNAKFDWNTFLKPSFESISKYIFGEAVCSLKISKKIYGIKTLDENGEKVSVGNKLEDVCSRNGVSLENAHRAISDCRALAECVLKMSNDYEIMRSSIENAEPVRLDVHRNLEIDYKIHGVKYWEPVKPRKRGELPPRKFYVDISPRDVEGLTDECYPGTVIFDINTKSWMNKDFLYNLDYREVERRVLEVSKVSSLKELYYIKRNKWKENTVRSE